MDQTTYNLLAPDVKTAAKTTAREWPGTIDEQDAEQEIWLELLDSGQKTIDIITGMERPNRVATLSHYGHRIAARYRDDYEVFSGNYTYGTKQVRRLLESDALADVDPGFWTLPETELKKLDRPDEVSVTEHMDLLVGMQRLVKKNANYADILVQAFMRNEPSHTYRVELTRAVDALTVEMNRSNSAQRFDHRNGGRGRGTVSGHTGQQIATRDWQGDASEGRR